jgi:RimJ/RimL family protein N-acetyltransferase
MKKKFTVRPLRFEDFKSLVDTYFTYYDELKENPSLGLTLFKNKPSMKEEVNWFADTYKQMLEGHKVVFIAEVDGKAIGICEVTRFRPGTIGDHKGILGIAMGKEYRSQGIGTALIEATLKECKGKFDIVMLSVYDDNKNAEHLYKKFGFKEYGTLPYSAKRGKKYTNEKLMYLKL